MAGRPAISLINHGSKIFGTALVFAEPGDVLAWHEHGFNDQHITIVAKGQFMMEVRDEAPCTISAGDLIDTPPHVWHQFTALTADARLFNICKEGPNR